MEKDFQKIICPSCKAEISLDEAITHQFEDAIKKQILDQQQAKQTELDKKEKEITEREKITAEAKKTLEKEVIERTEKAKTELEKELRVKLSKEKEVEINALSEEIKTKDKSLAEARKAELEFRLEKTKFEDKKQAFELEKQRQLDQEREKIKVDALRVFEADRQTKDKEKEEEIKLLNTQLEANKKQLDETRTKELGLRKEKIDLENDKRAFELEKQRQLDAERDKIREDAQKKAEEDMHLKILEKEKQLQDAMKANMELQRKLQQGSQQTQGEVQELDLESFLKDRFIYDEILPVPKGIAGADVLQRVVTKNEIICGTILWESKRTKNWSEGWIGKLKDNQREAKSDIAVIVSEVLPKDINNFAFRNGIWITNRTSLHGLAMALRNQLTQVAFVKRAAEGKDEKVELLFSYLTGSEFRQKVEAMVDTFVSMKQELDKEKRSTMARWGKQEKQIDKIIAITAGMHGDLRGLVGTSMQSIPALEAGEESEETEMPVPQIEEDEPDVDNSFEGKKELLLKDIPF